MSSEPGVYTIVIDGKRLLVISVFIALMISFISIYVSGSYITQDESLPLHIDSATINGTQVSSTSFGSTTIYIQAGKSFSVNLTVQYAEGYFTSTGYYYASPYYAFPGGYYNLFPSAVQSHQAILSIYNNGTCAPVQLVGQGGTLSTGSSVTYNFTLMPLEAGEYIFKFMVWSDWISSGGARIADNSGGYVKVVVS